jgi:TolB protein
MALDNCLKPLTCNRCPKANTSPTWSPDGRQIAFEASNRIGGVWWIMIMNSDGTGQRRLISNTNWAGSPAWSPDGTRIAYAATANHHDDIFVVGIDGVNPVKLTNSPASADSPTWSPDGTRIAFTSGLSYGEMPTPDIFVVEVSTLVQTRLTDSDNYGSNPDWRR